jgi:quinol monooxygenase YgiN
MSIVVNLYYTGVNGNARKFVEEMENLGIADNIRKEAGNLKYDYFQSLNDPETILLIDAWENQEAIDIHHASEMMNQLAKLREKYDLHMKVERYVTDISGIPDKDQEFIKK